ncbi:hypothetical protein [Streptomyces sp. OP7]|uniref:hypothetical protein n=1 Tax=Streptomyces sp. OP7 TaxID=3142462 RepID=UPI0032E9124B
MLRGTVRRGGPLPAQQAEQEHRARHQRQPDGTPPGRRAHHARSGPGYGCC